MNRLLDFIEDDELRRELEKVVVEELSKTDITILTNAYVEEDLAKGVLQFLTYEDDELYGGEVIVPDGETYNDADIDIIRRQIEDIIYQIEEILD